MQAGGGRVVEQRAEGPRSTAGTRVQHAGGGRPRVAAGRLEVAQDDGPHRHPEDCLLGRQDPHRCTGLGGGEAEHAVHDGDRGTDPAAREHVPDRGQGPPNLFTRDRVERLRALVEDVAHV